MAILDEHSVDFVSSSEAQTVRLGVRLGELLQIGDFLGLSGELGTGKTAMARGIGRGWGTALRVTSPTFTIVNEYPRMNDGRVLYHIDGYRLSGRTDIITAGINDILDAKGAFMAEWPEHIEAFLPADRLWIAFRYLTITRRSLRFSATGPRSTQLLKAFRQSAFGK
jgi:tRNA threonylcarbamoyladenosine biosynthesis protein TsaE